MNKYLARALRATAPLLAAVPLVATLGGCGASPQDSEESAATSSAPLTISKFKGWTPIPGGGVLISGPAVATRTATSIDVFAVATDSTVYTQDAFSLDNGATWTWQSSWSPPGAPNSGGVLGKPAATAAMFNGNLGLALAARATVGGLRQVFVRTWFPVNPFTPWTQVANGDLITDPAVVYSGTSLIVFGVATDHRVWFSKNDVRLGYTASNWTAWTPIPGGNLTSAVGAAAHNGELYVTALDTNNHIALVKSINGSTWGSWISVIPGNLTFKGGPAITAGPSNGQLNLFATVNDSTKAMYNGTSTDDGVTWGGFQSAGGALNDGPGAASPIDGTIQTAGLATDKNVWFNLYKE